MANATNVWRLRLTFNPYNMRQQIEQALDYYRAQYPDTVIFFRLGMDYIAFGEDTVKTAPLIGVKHSHTYGMESLSIPYKCFLEKLEVLQLCGIAFRGITYLDDNGNYAVPDVERLKAEEEIDY